MRPRYSVAGNARDQLAAHVRDELGMAAIAVLDHATGRIVRAGVRVRGDPAVTGGDIASGSVRTPAIVIVALIPLAALGLTGARLRGANQTRATVRETAWGALAMAVTYGIGALVGTAT
jgi:hypothetical protein